LVENSKKKLGLASRLKYEATRSLVNWSRPFRRLFTKPSGQ
jgi:hypothetical protein